MNKGIFIDFNLPFKKEGSFVSSVDQALAILDKARALVNKGLQGVAITYSANYDQTQALAKAYRNGDWKAGIAGANQADVMFEMEGLMSKKYVDLQGKMHIAPITTMNGYGQPLDPWNDKVHLGIVVKDLANIKDQYLEKGWAVLGWQNQSTVKNPNHPYAVGGGIASLPEAISEKIQQSLIGYAKEYAVEPVA